jgi:hypothetical protein
MATCRDFQLTRRSLLKAGLGALGLTLPDLLGLRALARAGSATSGFGQAKSCIVIFSWGGMSQLESFDPKPDAPAEIRGPTNSIGTKTPGVQFAEHFPLLAQQTERLAVVRSVCHRAGGHRHAAYWNLTGHKPDADLNNGDVPVMPSRKDWPCIGSMVSHYRRAKGGLPGSVCVPYPIADRGLQNGQDGGFLGVASDPMVVHPGRGTAYAGLSPLTGNADLHLPKDVDAQRLVGRQALLDRLTNASGVKAPAGNPLPHYQEMATDLLLRPEVAGAFDLDKEPAKLREQYGEHICGQSTLLARRLVEAGVPLVTVYSSAGDLNGGAGDHWDTHADNFNRIKTKLAPPLDRASTTLLDDLADRGRLDETLVVWLTEFGRTPRIGANSGRDHFPHCYSVAFAGGGIRGGQVYGRSDKTASAPLDFPCGPGDLHATIFHALGISPDAHVTDTQGKPAALCEGQPLPLFA